LFAHGINQILVTFAFHVSVKRNSLLYPVVSQGVLPLLTVIINFYSSMIAPHIIFVINHHTDRILFLSAAFFFIVEILRFNYSPNIN